MSNKKKKKIKKKSKVNSQNQVNFLSTKLAEKEEKSSVQKQKKSW